MKHWELEEGRRRRERLAWIWRAAVVLAASVVFLAFPVLRRYLCSFACVAFIIAICLPAYLVSRRNRQIYRWYLRGRCLTCGYDLRASEECCPECGRPSGPLRL